MAFNMKTAAERLLKLADVLEKEAHDKTFFVCDRCNHTAALSTINQRRKEASERLKIEHTASVSVNDTLSCPVPGCVGTMTYVATDDSERYYMDEDQTPAEVTPPEVTPPATNEEQPPTDEKKDKLPTEDAINPDNIFQPVDEQGQPPSAEEELDLSFGPEDTADADKDTERTKTDQDLNLNFDNEGVTPEKPSDKPISEEETPSDDVPSEDKELAITDSIPSDKIKPEEGVVPAEDAPIMDTPPTDQKNVPEVPMDESPSGAPASEEAPAAEAPEAPEGETPMEETPSEEEPVEKTRDKRMDFPKKALPKFEKMPKDASDDFIEAVVRYSL